MDPTMDTEGATMQLETAMPQQEGGNQLPAQVPAEMNSMPDKEVRRNPVRDRKLPDRYRQ